ncbi:sulfurtransferase TusA [Aestuariicella sp. G3-2]|uniref:sulfurtransferase TusA n=1 Tax=Pseudomaricurvus albidus TaxID=2842452 RepID=UPI001C0CBD0A|nr:sulfurtransferase TusA [Aestuariicella albida]MBU3070803.1 sulfurtransferase TusA [Aestuariicella albida]
MTQTFDHNLDTTGLTCPEPVMLLHKAIRDAKSGEVVKVVATDPSTERDIPKFCQFLGHELLEAEVVDGEAMNYCYWIRKK